MGLILSAPALDVADEKGISFSNAKPIMLPLLHLVGVVRYPIAEQGFRPPITGIFDMMAGIDISRIRELPEGFEALLEESTTQGYSFLQRLSDDWGSGANRFSQPGEALFEARRHGTLVGVCGINRDPHADDESIGRVRRLYVLDDDRRRGVGRWLVERILEHAKGTFRVVRVNAPPQHAARFYEAIGFESLPGDDSATHAVKM